MCSLIYRYIQTVEDFLNQNWFLSIQLAILIDGEILKLYSVSDSES